MAVPSIDEAEAESCVVPKAEVKLASTAGLDVEPAA